MKHDPHFHSAKCCHPSAERNVHRSHAEGMWHVLYKNSLRPWKPIELASQATQAACSIPIPERMYVHAEIMGQFSVDCGRPNVNLVAQGRQRAR